MSRKAALIVNGTEHLVDGELGADYRLIDFLRDKCLTKSVKQNCGEGGCGACIVVATKVDPVTNGTKSFSINSCLTPVLSCDGWEITTTEGLGSQRRGLHHIQKRLASGHGIQCGFCSPGMVMSMAGLEMSKGDLSMSEVERALDGNLCRCTGYRPILDAFKSAAKNASKELKQKFCDIEDAATNICKRTLKSCNGVCHPNGGLDSLASQTTSAVVLPSGEVWHYPTTMTEALHIIKNTSENGFRLLSGNTGCGVYKEVPSKRNVIDTNRIQELHEVSFGDQLSIGAGVGLTVMIEVFREYANRSGFEYLTALADHLELVGNTAVRNTGSIAGNLMLKKQHIEFPSDIFVILETVGAKLNIASCDGAIICVSLVDFLSLHMANSIAVSIQLSPLLGSKVVTYKITPRSVNAHAYVNAGFCFETNSEFLITQRPRIVYGGIHPEFNHAKRLEDFLLGKYLNDESTVAKALSILEEEITPDENTTDASPEYRKGLAKNLFYKAVLTLLGETVSSHLKSGGSKLVRPLSKGKQEFDHQKDEYPVGKPMKKLEADAQATGEAEFVGDISQQPNQLYAAVVAAPVGPAVIDRIDAREALEMHGVIRLITAEDIPGMNSFCDREINYMSVAGDEELIFATDEIKYAGQAVALIVAKTQRLANEAAKKVVVHCKDTKRPILDVKEALEIPERVRQNNSFGPVQRFSSGDYEEAKKNAVRIIKGEWFLPAQHHFPMETQTALCIPIEDGMDVFLATQDADTATSAISRSLGLQKNRINLQVRRLGGGFGHKASRSAFVGCACAVAAYVLEAPVSLVMDLQSNLEVLGGRTPFYAPYEVGVDNEGLLQSVKIDFYGDVGSSFNESVSGLAAQDCRNGYSAKAWKVVPWSVKTDKPSNAFMRAPGSDCGIGVMEVIMDHIAHEMNMDSVELRLKNLKKEEPPSVSPHGAFSGFQEGLLRNLVDELKVKSEYGRRKTEVELFNQENRWKKRGLALNLMTYPFELSFFKYNVLVSIYHNGGTVSIAHGGVEMGQGINTKAAQIAARELGIPVEMISVKPTNVLTNPNGSVSAASTTSELNCYAVYKACQELAERIRAVKESLGKEVTWPQLVEICHQRQVDLCSRYQYSARDKIPGYNVYAGIVTEVELDVLTGEKQILRVDLVEDAGRSVSPWIDIGQIEGAFVQGLGLYMTEQVKRNKETGKLISNGTWHYKLPTVFDIPIEFNVTMLSNVENVAGVLRSKTTGEPALVLAVSALNALRHALLSARADAGTTGWFDFNPPAMPEFLQRLALTSDQHLKVTA